MINECFTGKMNLLNFHLPSLQEHIHKCYKSTQFMHSCMLHELLHCTCRCMYNCFKMLLTYLSLQKLERKLLVITKVIIRSTLSQTQ